MTSTSSYTPPESIRCESSRFAPTLRFATAILIGVALIPQLARSATTFVASAADGGGFQNVVAVDPFNGSHVVMGSDTSAMFRSFDKGATFNPQELNAAGTLPMFGKTQSISAVSFGPTSDVIYAAFGCSYNSTTDTLSGGGFLRSTDGGDHWELMSTVPQTWGSNQADEQVGAPTEHPRSTGKLIAHNTTGNLFIGTFRDGVVRSTVADGGANWEAAGISGGALGGKFIRGICVPYTSGRANVMLVATWDGCYLSNNINTATASNITFTQQTGAPAKVEEIVYLGADDRFYAVCNNNGVYQITYNGGNGATATTWTKIGSTSVPSSSRWASIDGFVSGSNVTLYIGCDAASDDGSGNFRSVMKATSSTTAFTFANVSLTPADPYDNSQAGVHYNLASSSGGTTTPWWFVKDNETQMQGFMLGKGTFVAAQIVINPSNSQHIYVAGRSGAWRSLDGGTNWWPIVKGLQVAYNRTAVVDPNVGSGNRIYIGNTDWKFIASNDGLATAKRFSPGTVGNVGPDVALDTSAGSGTPSQVYFCTTNRDQTGTPKHRDGGEVYWCPDPYGASPSWTDLDLGAATGSRGVFAISFRKIGSTRYLLAATDGEGVWRSSWTTATPPATMTWTQVSATAMGSPRKPMQTPMVWALDSAVFLLDRETGLWRGSNNGATWTNVWNDSHAGGNTDMTGGSDFTGFMVVQIPSAGVVRLFISMKGKVWLVNDAQTGNRDSWSPIDVGSGTLSNPGPISVAKGNLFITDNSNPSRFYRASNLSGTPNVAQEDNGAGSFYSISPAASTPTGLATYWTGSVYKHYVVGNGVIKSQ